MRTPLELLVDEALAEQGSVELCREILMEHAPAVIDRLAQLYPHLSRGVVEAIWESGVEVFIKLAWIEPGEEKESVVSV